MVRVIGIASGKGGVGKTTVSTNLALALRDFGKKILLIDCNLSTPHLAYYLGVSNYKNTLNDAMLGKIDINLVTHLKDGIKYIPASLNMKDLEGVNILNIKKYIGKINKEKYDFIILDAAPGLGKEAIAVLDASDEIIFVTTPFVPMMNDVIRSSKILRKMHGSKSINMVINMVTNNRHEILSKNIEEFTKFPVIGEISFDWNVVHGLSAKLPIINFKPKSIASINFRELASNLIGIKYNVPKQHKIKIIMRKFRNKLLNRSKINMSQKREELMKDFDIENLENK